MRSSKLKHFLRMWVLISAQIIWTGLEVRPTILIQELWIDPFYQKRILQIFPLLNYSCDNIQFQSTTVDASIQSQLDALKACVEQHKRSEEDRKNMMDALKREGQERK